MLQYVPGCCMMWSESPSKDSYTLEYFADVCNMLGNGKLKKQKR